MSSLIVAGKGQVASEVECRDGRKRRVSEVGYRGRRKPDIVVEAQKLYQSPAGD